MMAHQTLVKLVMLFLITKNRYGESRGVGPSRYRWKTFTNLRPIKQESWQFSKSGLSRSILNELSRIDAAIERTFDRSGKWIYLPSWIAQHKK